MIPFKLLKIIPRLIAITYAITLIISSLSLTLRTGDLSHFLINGVGNVVAGSDKEISQNIDNMIIAKEKGERDWFGFISILGSLLLIFYILKIFKKAISSILAVQINPESALWGISFVILFLFQTVFYTATTGELTLGFTGVWKFLTHADYWIYPVQDWILSIGELSIKSPIF